MADQNGNEYPQEIKNAEENKAARIKDCKGPDYFKNGNNIVFMRAEKINGAHFDGRNISVSCLTRGYINRVVQTHETKMNQFAVLEEKTGALNLRIQIWSDSVFRVRFGREPIEDREPEFPPLKGRMLTGSPEKDIGVLGVIYEEKEDMLRVSTDKFTLEINKSPLRLRAVDSDGRLFWEQYRTDLFTSDIFDISTVEDNGRKACFESFKIRNKEEIYGLGERFDHVTRRGKKVDFWNKDAIGTSNGRTYINVPFLFSTEGYGLFLNSSAMTEWEVGTLEASCLGFSIEDSMMDYFIIYGPTPAEILYKYCALTGFPALPPVWSFGLWMSRNSYTSWDIAFEVANKLRERDIPSDVLHLDTAWFKDDWNCDLKFSEERFPNPGEHMKKLLEMGFRISLWQYNFIPPRENNDNYREALEKGYIALGEDGKPFRYPDVAIGGWLDDVIIDFSNPEACEWYAGKIKELIKLGAVTIKTDFGEGIPEDAIYKNVEGSKFHNLYSLVYNSVVAGAVKEISGENIVWARSGTAGSQRYPIHWGGDSQCSFEGLSGTLRAALSIGLSGFAFFSHDIGGFIGRPSPELYVRWAQLGLFSSHSRCHGAGDFNSREPWSFGEEAERIFRKYAKLRYSLLPYIYEQAEKCCKTAKPMLRALLVEYPEDRNVWHIDDQYLFGDSLLIAPVLEPLEISAQRTLYLPAGTWFDYWTKEIIHSTGMWIKREVDLETMPIYVKLGAVLKYAADRPSTFNRVGDIAKVEAYGCRYFDKTEAEVIEY